jgi:hypothetical protein
MKPDVMFDDDWDNFSPEERARLLSMTNDERREMEWAAMETGADTDLVWYEILQSKLQTIESTPEADRTDRDRWLLGKLRAFFAAHPNPPPPEKDQP